MHYKYSSCYESHFRILALHPQLTYERVACLRPVALKARRDRGYTVGHNVSLVFISVSPARSRNTAGGLVLRLTPNVVSHSGVEGGVPDICVHTDMPVLHPTAIISLSLPLSLVYERRPAQYQQSEEQHSRRLGTPVLPARSRPRPQRAYKPPR